jgi:16S rRNA (guanine527-N7)-methyltransferase
MSVSRETSPERKPWREKLRASLYVLIDNCPDQLIEKLTLFGHEILEENELLHLISQRDPERELVKQILDSAAICQIISFCPGCRLLDLGSGAGFPGVVLKLIFPEIELHSLDSSPRKIEFQRRACEKLEVEALFHQSDFRRTKLEQRVDVIIVKALGTHREVIRRSRTLLRPSGKLIFMEGKTPDPAIESSMAESKGFSHATYLRYSPAGLGSTRHLAIVYRK